MRFDARQFNWLGSTGTSNLMTVAWHTSGFKTMDDVMARELVTGATGIGSGTFIYPNAMNVVLGTKFKIVMGYKSTAELDLAMERGEVAARAARALPASCRSGRPGSKTTRSSCSTRSATSARRHSRTCR